MTNVYNIRQWARSPRRELTMQGTRWTDADDAALRTYYAERLPVEQIATRLGRTVSAVKHRAGLLGLAKRLASSARTRKTMMTNDAPTNAPHPADNAPEHVSATPKQRGYMVNLARAISATYEAISTSRYLTEEEARKEIDRLKITLAIGETRCLEIMARTDGARLASN